MSFAASTGREALRRQFGQHGDHLIGAHPACCGGDRRIARNREHITCLAGFQLRAQPWIDTVNLVGSHPSHISPVQRTGDYPLGQLGFGGEGGAGRYSGSRAAGRVISPAAGFVSVERSPRNACLLRCNGMPPNRA